MKLIIAMISPDRLEAVQAVLHPLDAAAAPTAIDERGNHGSLFVMPLQAWIRSPGNDVGCEIESDETAYESTVC